MLNFSGLKDFDVAALGRDAPAPTGQPCELPVALIHPDPDNIRTACSETEIVELAETIRVDGLLQAITVRPHPTLPGAYLISYGERRFRAVRLLGFPTIAAVIDERFDPYRQAIENLQREELTPLELAQFVAKREAAGDSRTEIAKRLGKSKSFISELALLASAPSLVRGAVEGARIDTRTAYLLARHYPLQPEKVTALLAGDAPLHREDIARELNEPVTSGAPVDLSAVRETPRSRGRRREYNALAVLLGGRTGIMRFEPGQPSNQATVQFADGTEELAPLAKISLKHWVRV
jgi:ParB family transcriptional regulator, chromosome partitioning protein